MECVGSKEYAVKSQRIKSKGRLAYNSSLDGILKEYFFNKIAAALGFGPKTENIFGYDLVCYNDRIEFAMELCEMKLPEEDTNFTADLLQGLKKMHTLKMVHRDVK